MSLLGILGLLVLTVVVGLLVLVLVGAARLQKLRRSDAARVVAVGDAELRARASFFGQASQAKNQVRGLGTLVLTAEVLVFVQITPVREIRIKRDSLTSVRLTRHFLGKTPGRDLLVVMWDDNGIGDAVAFDVPNSSDWVSRLS